MSVRWPCRSPRRARHGLACSWHGTARHANCLGMPGHGLRVPLDHGLLSPRVQGALGSWGSWGLGPWHDMASYCLGTTAFHPSFLENLKAVKKRRHGPPFNPRFPSQKISCVTTVCSKSLPGNEHVLVWPKGKLTQ